MTTSWMGRLLACALLLGSVPCFSAPPVERDDLDRLLAQRLPADSHYVRMVAARTVALRATVQTLPRPGKTGYLMETLQMRGIKPLPRAGHKMLLRSPAGATVMAYVEDAAAARMLKELKAGDEVSVTATYLWDSRHGPGLLVTGYEHAGLSWSGTKESLIRWFGGKPHETGR